MVFGCDDCLRFFVAFCVVEKLPWLKGNPPFCAKLYAINHVGMVKKRGLNAWNLKQPTHL